MFDGIYKICFYQWREFLNVEIMIYVEGELSLTAILIADNKIQY